MVHATIIIKVRNYKIIINTKYILTLPISRDYVKPESLTCYSYSISDYAYTSSKTNNSNSDHSEHYAISWVSDTNYEKAISL